MVVINRVILLLSKQVLIMLMYVMGQKCKVLVDCGATTHIINDRSKFVKFDETFDPQNHLKELADGSRTSGVVSGRGNVSVLVRDVNGSPHKMILENALYVPSYKQQTKEHQ